MKKIIILLFIVVPNYSYADPVKCIDILREFIYCMSNSVDSKSSHKEIKRRQDKCEKRYDKMRKKFKC